MMAEKNLCAVLYGPKDLRLEERPVPVPLRGEVQINIRSVGICGSDSILYRTGHGSGVAELLDSLVVLGHEPCGVVSRVGPGVTSLVIGDRVALSSQLQGCRKCSICLGGRANLCPDTLMMTVPPVDGALSNYFVWPAELCYKLPSNLTWTEGAMVQPVALGVFGCQRAGVSPGQRLLVCGAGPLGMIMVLTAKANGATRICVTDICEKRTQFLASVSGCCVCRADDGTPRDVAARVTSLLGGYADVTMECSGTASGVSTAIYATKPGGCILVAGLGPPEVQIPLVDATLKEIDIKGMIMYNNTYPAALDLMSSGQLDVKPLVTHTFDLCDIIKAFEAMLDKVPGKIIVRCSDD